LSQARKQQDEIEEEEGDKVTEKYLFIFFKIKIFIDHDNYYKENQLSKLRNKKWKVNQKEKIIMKMKKDLKKD